MKFSVGDKVRFLNEKGEGTISRIINKTMVAVTIEDGFEIPYVITELVTVYDAAVAVTAAKVEVSGIPVPLLSKKDDRKKEQDGIYAAICPEKINDISHSDFNFWLINHTSYEIIYCCSTCNNDSFEIFDKGEAKPFESKIAATIDRKKMDDFATIKIDVLFFNTKKFDHRAPVSEIIKIKQARLYKENAFSENNFVSEKALIINVSNVGNELFFDTAESKNMDLSELLFQKGSGRNAPKISKPHTKNSLIYEMEIDLHIEELMDDYKRMSNAEIIQVQLRHFQQALDQAFNDHCRSLTVIHGVGNGRLKQEIRNILSANNIRFHDASYAKYGFGATEVVIS